MVFFHLVGVTEKYKSLNIDVAIITPAQYQLQLFFEADTVLG